jgi:hypothetical protein
MLRFPRVDLSPQSMVWRGRTAGYGVGAPHLYCPHERVCISEGAGRGLSLRMRDSVGAHPVFTYHVSMNVQEVRQWITLGFAVVGGISGLAAVWQNVKQRKVEGEDHLPSAGRHKAV